jgi:hypothetical protein
MLANRALNNISWPYLNSMGLASLVPSHISIIGEAFFEAEDRAEDGLVMLLQVLAGGWSASWYRKQILGFPYRNTHGRLKIFVTVYARKWSFQL